MVAFEKNQETVELRCTAAWIFPREESKGGSLNMPEKVDLYNNAYGNFASRPYRQVRIETYETIGRN